MAILANNVDELREQIRQKEGEITAQLDRVYALVEQKRPPQFVQLEFKRAVERITEKYALLSQMLQERKDDLGESEFSTQEEAIKSQYKEDVVTLAVAIDEAIDQPIA